MASLTDHASDAHITIRPATRDDDAHLEGIERAADALLIDRFGATDWPPPTLSTVRAEMHGFVLVAEVSVDEHRAVIVGFVHVLLLDDQPHLEQLSVLPSHGRRGIGRSLVDAAKAEALRQGHERMTLRTYTEVPWNAPFYATCGFRPSDPHTPERRRLVQIERDLGLHAFGDRQQMTAQL
jgi:GNAT superfamily N-acetyltransferase